MSARQPAKSFDLSDPVDKYVWKALSEKLLPFQSSECEIRQDAKVIRYWAPDRKKHTLTRSWSSSAQPSTNKLSAEEAMESENSDQSEEENPAEETEASQPILKDEPTTVPKQPTARHGKSLSKDQTKFQPTRTFEAPTLLPVQFPSGIKTYHGEGGLAFTAFVKSVETMIQRNLQANEDDLVSALLSLIGPKHLVYFGRPANAEEFLDTLTDLFGSKANPFEAVFELTKLDPSRGSFEFVWRQFLSTYEACLPVINNDDENILGLFRHLMKSHIAIPWDSIESSIGMSKWMIAHGSKLFLKPTHPAPKHSQSTTKNSHSNPHSMKNFNSPHRAVMPVPEKKGYNNNKGSKTEIKKISDQSRLARVDPNDLRKIGSVKQTVTVFGSKNLAVAAEIDAGADDNIIAKNVAEKAGCKLVQTKSQVFDWQGKVTPIRWTTSLDVFLDDRWKSLKFLVSEAPSLCLLGKPSMALFGLMCDADDLYVKKETFAKSTLPPVYNNGILAPQLPVQMNFQMTNDAPLKPTMPLYPANLNPVMDSLLSYLEEAGHIERDNDSSPHTLSAWPKVKPGKETEARSWKSGDPAIDRIYRLLLDCSKFNLRVSEQEYGPPPPTIFAFKMKAAEFKYKSRIDLKNAFFCVTLPVHLRHYFAFNTHKGKYRMRSMPQGAVFSPKFLQANLSLLLEEFKQKTKADLELLNYADDIWLFTNQKEEALIDQLTKHLATYNFVVSTEKTIAFATSFSYGGFNFLPDGSIVPKPEYLEKIYQAKMPSTKLQWSKFLGICEFIGSHLPALAILRQSIQKHLDAAPSWKSKLPVSPELVTTFTKLKSLCSKPVSLDLPDKSLPLVLVGDTGKTGAAYLLCQNFNPALADPLSSPDLKKIAFYSKSLKHNLDDANLVEQDGINAASLHFAPIISYWPPGVFCYNDNLNVSDENRTTKSHSMVCKKNKLVAKGIFLKYRRIPREKISLLDHLGKIESHVHRMKVMHDNVPQVNTPPVVSPEESGTWIFLLLKKP